MRRIAFVFLLLAICAGLLAGCGKSSARTPMTQERFEQILQSHGYETTRISEVSKYTIVDGERRTRVPTDVLLAQASGLSCGYFSFDNADDARAWAASFCMETAKRVQVHQESGGNWDRFTAQNNEGKSWKFLRVENVVLYLGTNSDEETAQKGEELFSALEAG